MRQVENNPAFPGHWERGERGDLMPFSYLLACFYLGVVGGLSGFLFWKKSGWGPGVGVICMCLGGRPFFKILNPFLGDCLL